MNRLINNTYVKSATNKGRGVFASRDLRKGQTVEVAHVVVVPDEEVIDGILNYYTFAWENGTSAVATGTALLYNHSEDANVDYIKDFSTATISFIAYRAIKKGQELTIDYGYSEPEMLMGKQAKRARGERY